MTAQTSEVGLLLRVCGGLLLLLAITFFLSLVPLGRFGLAASLLVSTLKMLLIAVYFMELRASRHLNWILAGAGAVWLSILFALVFSDYMTR